MKITIHDAALIVIAAVLVLAFLFGFNITD
jgi:hypothetical protein